MIVNQRWRHGRASYRPAGETIVTSEYAVERLPEGTARAFVIGHHYSSSYPAARERFGLFRGSELVGVAVFSHPCSDRVLTNVFPDVPTTETVELGRFVLLDEVPGNGETWFLGQVFRDLRRNGYAGVVSFSDPIARTSAAGAVVFPGHIGTIYQAHNAAYLGRTVPRSIRLLPDGTMLSARSIQKIRGAEKGWRGVVDTLLEHGAPTFSGERREWLTVALQKTTRILRHAGNHRYAWGFTPVTRRMLVSGAYPKVGAA
jgi:hypothetical protein